MMGAAIDKCRICGETTHTSDEGICHECYRCAEEHAQDAIEHIKQAAINPSGYEVPLWEEEARAVLVLVAQHPVLGAKLLPESRS